MLLPQEGFNKDLLLRFICKPMLCQSMLRKLADTFSNTSRSESTSCKPCSAASRLRWAHKRFRSSRSSSGTASSSKASRVFGFQSRRLPSEQNHLSSMLLHHFILFAWLHRRLSLSWVLPVPNFPNWFLWLLRHHGESRTLAAAAMAEQEVVDAHRMPCMASRGSLP